MKKSKPFVTIPQGSVCIPLSDVLFTHAQLSSLRKSNSDMSQEITQKDDLIAGMDRRIAELETKLAEVEEELKRENSEKLYWYERYMDLFNSADKKGDPNAQAKTS